MALRCEKSFVSPPSLSPYAHLPFLLNTDSVVKFIVKNIFKKLSSSGVSVRPWVITWVRCWKFALRGSWGGRGLRGGQKRSRCLWPQGSTCRDHWPQGSTWTWPRCGGSRCGDDGCLSPCPSPFQPCCCVLDSIHAYLLL